MTIDVFVPKKKPSVILDATLLSSLMSCARYHDIRFNARMVPVGGKSNSLETGSMMHKILEVYYKQKIAGFPVSTAEGNAFAAGMLYTTGCPHCASALEYPKDEQGNELELPCKHEPGEYPGLQNTPEDNEPHREGQGARIGWRYVLQTVEQYFGLYNKRDSFIPLTVEEVVKETIYEDDDIRIGWKAKLDLKIDTNQIGIISMDHKTMKQRRQQTKLSNQFLGHCVLLKSRNVMKNNIGFQVSLKPEEKFTRELISYSADHIEEWRTEIVPYYAWKYLQFKETEYWPPDYTHCDNIYGSCAYKQICESDRGMREAVLRAEYIKAPVWDPRNKDDE